MKTPVIGMDIAKHVFQLHAVDVASGKVERVRLKRGEVVDFFAKRERSIVAIEACGGAHHWARQLGKFGHDVRLIAAHSVRPFVLRNKSDAADARGIWTAAQQPEARFVAVKSETQQSILALHRMRAQLMKFRIMQTNALRGILYEFGEILSEGYQPFTKEIVPAFARISERLPAMLVESLREQWTRVQAISDDIASLERRLSNELRLSTECRRIAEIPGVGLLTATATVAAIGDSATFRSGREFAAWLGLVPRQTGTGGRIRQLGLSKRGNTYLRTLLMHGARSVILRGTRTPWLDALLARRPFNVVVAAVANKLARTIWAILSRQTRYEAPVAA